MHFRLQIDLQAAILSGMKASFWDVVSCSWDVPSWSWDVPLLGHPTFLLGCHVLL